MTGLWLVSYIVLWALFICISLLILALSKEIETLHARLDLTKKYLTRTEFDIEKKEIKINNRKEERTNEMR